MSQLADQERRVKRSWARPGSSHDVIVKMLKFGLPALVGLILAFLALVPLEERKEVSFLLDKNKVERAGERLKVESAEYRGLDEVGRAFVVSARLAVQASSAEPVVQVSDMRAQMALEDGPAMLTAETARYNMDSAQVAVTGPVRFRAEDGYQIDTSNVMVDLRGRTMHSQAPVEGRTPLGTFWAQRMSADLPQRTVVLEGRARLHIEQGAFRRQP